MSGNGLAPAPGIFSFAAIERVVWGRPAAHALRDEVERLDARRVFLIVSGTMNRVSDEVSRVREALGGRYAGLYDRVPPHIPAEAVLEAAEAAKSVNADLIVTFGGGSVTGAGKVVQLCLRHGIRDLEGLNAYRVKVNPDGTHVVPDYEGPSIRQIAIPTTLSAGEFNPFGGVTDRCSKIKLSFRHPLLVPRVTIFDPAPTVHTPLSVWLSTGMSAIAHATEGICSQFSNPVSDAGFFQALKLLSRWLPHTKQHPDDLDARLNCQLASWLSVAGRQGGVQMGASHAIGHVLGGACEVPHGYTSCVMLPHVLRYNRTANADRQRLVADAMGHPGEDAGDVMEAFVASLGLPRRLQHIGVGRELFPELATRAMRDSWIHTNPRSITDAAQVMEILEAAA